MKRFLILIALFSLAGALAQPFRPTSGREPLRGPLIAAPSAAEAETALPEACKYLFPLDEWSVEETTHHADFTVPFAWANRQVFVHIGPAASEYELLVNGKSAGYHADPNFPADFNVTKISREGKNQLAIRFTEPSEMASLESWKQPSAWAFDGAYVYSQPTMYIRDVTVKNWSVDWEPRAEVGIIVRTAGLNPKTSRIHYDLRTPDSTRLASGHQDLTLGMRGEDTIRFVIAVPDSLRWSAESPVLCQLRLKTQYEGRYMEYICIPLGFRTIEMHQGEMFVNGSPTPLRIREIDPSTPIGEMTRIKAQGYNAVKLRAGAVTEGFYAAADTLGIYVIAQAPIDTRRSGTDIRKGGNPTNDPAWLPAFLERTADSYHSTKRHPSVVAFSLAEKSANGINLYESYLNMKRIDETRPFIYPDAGGEWNSDSLLTGSNASMRNGNMK